VLVYVILVGMPVEKGYDVTSYQQRPTMRWQFKRDIVKTSTAVWKFVAELLDLD